MFADFTICKFSLIFLEERKTLCYAEKAVNQMRMYHVLRHSVPFNQK